MISSKKIYFKKLDELCKKVALNGIKEVKTIALVYQVAFKVVERNNNISHPMSYYYTEHSFNKKIAQEHQPEIVETALLLLKVIKEEEAFTDLVTRFVEEADVLNKKVAQFFTPSDVADGVCMFSNIYTTIDKFEQHKYFSIDDSTGCGTGSLMLAQLRSFKNINDFKSHHYQSVYVNMNDLDEDVSKIAFFQVLLSSLLHNCPVGKIEVQSRNLITEYEQVKNLNFWISNIEREEKDRFYRTFERSYLQQELAF